MDAAHVLIVDDEIEMCRSLEELLRQDGYQTTSTTDPGSVPALARDGSFDAVVLDIQMPEFDGISLLQALQELYPEIPVVMITGYPSVDSAVRAMKYGAANYFPKPLDLPALLKELGALTSMQRRTVVTSDPEEPIVTNSRPMRTILEAIGTAGEVDAPVLVTGETGTGKELVAQAIHARSDRRDGPFVRVNCAAIPDSLIETELFGHEAGAFTDAKHARKGRFEMAHGGTLFLDEIGDMSLPTQARILHALQEKTFERVGGSTSIVSDIRIVAATHRDLDAMTESGDFRKDLFYRLSVILLRLPPLRERGNDVSLLADHFAALFAEKYGKPAGVVSEEVRELFRRHSWPGNVRELRNCVERAVIFSTDTAVGLADLPAQYREALTVVSPVDPDERVANLNRDIIDDALKRSNGVKSRAAEILNISRRTLYNRMKRLGME